VGSISFTSSSIVGFSGGSTYADSLGSSLGSGGGFSISIGSSSSLTSSSLVSSFSSSSYSGSASYSSIAESSSMNMVGSYLKRARPVKAPRPLPPDFLASFLRSSSYIASASASFFAFQAMNVSSVTLVPPGGSLARSSSINSSIGISS